MKVHYMIVDGQAVEVSPEEGRVQLRDGQKVFYGELPESSEVADDEDEEDEP